jgi:bifunctional DNA-binding transcriptional regulator/antitoxin component of YhaV-PrlF toxin-antitoxin module
MSFARVHQGGQIALPAEIRSRFGIRSKDKSSTLRSGR